jgi:drug/metabolite transporter (DMT)-like permease
VAFAVDLVLWNHAIADVGAGVATVLGNLQVLFVALAAWAIFRERPTARFAVALPVVAAGVVLVAGVVGGSSFGRHPTAGIVYGVGTSIAYAVFILMIRSVSARTAHVATQLFDATATAGISAMVAGVAAGTMQFDPGWPALGWLTTLAIVSQVLGWLLITTSLPRLPAAVASIMLLLQPAASMALAAVVLSQHPTGWQLGGAALVCAGVLVAATRSRMPEGDLVLGATEGAAARA